MNGFGTMAKTAAERETLRRARLKMIKDAYKEYKDKDRERKQKWRAEMDDSEAAAFEKRSMLATRKWRANKGPDKTPSAGCQETQFPYKSPASFGKARRRVPKGLTKKSLEKTSSNETYEYNNGYFARADVCTALEEGWSYCCEQRCRVCSH